MTSVYFDPISTAARSALEPLDLREVTEPEQAALLWLRKDYRRWFPELAEHQLLNHIPGEGVMTRKADLAWILHDRMTSHPHDAFTANQFYQETFDLSEAGEREAFLAQLPDEDHPDNLWILKPSTLARGEGIQVLWQMDGLREQLQDTSKRTLTHEGEELEYVIQRYIKDVLLLDNRKSELRVYWTIASVDPLVALVYPEGLVRLSSQEFDLHDLDNTTAHIVNVFQQKKDPEYDPDQVLKWDFPRLESYLKESHGIRGPQWIQTNLLPKLKRALGYVAKAMLDKILETQPEQGSFFGVYGADFILDQNLTPWLAEVQKGPGLAFDDPVKQQLVPHMLQEAVKIALEVQAKSRAGIHLSDLESVEKFEWIHRPVRVE